MHTGTSTPKRTTEGERPRSLDRSMDLVLEGLRQHRPPGQVCREAGVSPERYRQWQQLMDAARNDVAGVGAERGVMQDHIAQLEAENGNLQRQVKLYRSLCVDD